MDFEKQEVNELAACKSKDLGLSFHVAFKISMMKYILLILICILICIFHTFADIAPNPIQAKGIISAGDNDIRMVSEQVIVDLYKDSSVVECQFNMRNEGKNQQINIGFPEMNFHHFIKTQGEDYRKAFTVFENEKKVSEIDAYTPNLKNAKDSLLIQQKGKGDYGDQPWYLWDSYFKEGEIKMIKVRYSLPVGVIKNRCNYFTYILNTGAGWKGSIDRAEIIVNLKDISNDLILKATPQNYQLSEHQMRWEYLNLEPTTNNDIKIYFESSKGMYEKMKSENPFPLVLFNQKPLPEWDVINDPTFLDRLTSYDLLDVKILKDMESTKKYNSGKDGVMIIYTKEYAIDKISKLLEARKSNTLPLVYHSPLDFMEKYKLVVDQTEYVDKNMLLKIVELEEKDIQNAKIINNKKGKTAIEVELKN